MTGIELIQQVGAAVVYYLGLITMARIAGKRLAGQTTNFDLIVLITMGVVLQGSLLEPGKLNAVTFVITVFVCHKLLALACARSDSIRHLARGKPRVLVRDGVMIGDALQAEGLSEADLRAGLRKLGLAEITDVKLATLEETGQIAAVPTDRAA